MHPIHYNVRPRWAGLAHLAEGAGRDDVAVAGVLNAHTPPCGRGYSWLIGQDVSLLGRLHALPPSTVCLHAASLRLSLLPVPPCVAQHTITSTVGHFGGIKGRWVNEASVVLPPAGRGGGTRGTGAYCKACSRSVAPSARCVSSMVVYFQPHLVDQGVACERRVGTRHDREGQEDARRASHGVVAAGACARAAPRACDDR